MLQNHDADPLRTHGPLWQQPWNSFSALKASRLLRHLCFPLRIAIFTTAFGEISVEHQITALPLPCCGCALLRWNFYWTLLRKFSPTTTVMHWLSSLSMHRNESTNMFLTQFSKSVFNWNLTLLLSRLPSGINEINLQTNRQMLHIPTASRELQKRLRLWLSAQGWAAVTTREETTEQYNYYETNVDTIW